MSIRPWLASLILLALPVSSQAAPAAAAAGIGYHRIDLPGAEGKPFPYTVEVPEGWKVSEVKDVPGLWLGPAGAEPPSDPRLVYVRISLAPFSAPEAMAANIRANDAKNETWSAPLVEVKDVGDVKGVLVRMDSGAADKARSTLALKLPLDKGGVDFMASAARGDFEKLLPTYERILLSVRRRAS
jgi:hypothetical protein